MYELPSTVEILKEWSKCDLLYSFIEVLNDKGIILDEENSVRGISSNILKKWQVECTAYLVEQGYEGGLNLSCLAFEVKEKGFVYALYDTELFEAKQVKKYIENYNYAN
jgi:hypothetical protein